MTTPTPNKQNLNSRSNELHDRLDKLIATIVREFDLDSKTGMAQLKKAKAICEDLKNLEPSIDALDDCISSNHNSH